uniref:CDP-diacylglycerol--inositol 3-phosphatidyltransferase n=1 Tax=Salix viminalis TaxID=40686 RepID=A0A6N2LJG0_SALVM
MKNQLPLFPVQIHLLIVNQNPKNPKSSLNPQLIPQNKQNPYLLYWVSLLCSSAGRSSHFCYLCIKASPMANNKMSRPRKPGKLSVYLYIPNIIGYTRVFMNCYAFAICFSNKWLFCALYFISFVCDGVDGWCARKFNQVSTFGAVLDMVTDSLPTSNSFSSLAWFFCHCLP